jgi:cytosine/adenosine deaminase-related metal-dependent hydrolase
MSNRTWIKNADCIIAWDETSRSHCYLKGGDLVFSEDRIEFVGRSYAGSADEILDGAGTLVMPGLVNIHSHPSTEPFYRGIREEQGVPQMYMTGLYERAAAFFPGMEFRRWAAEAAYCEMLLSGVTTVADLSVPYEGWIDVAARSGLRVFLAPGFASAVWHRADDWRLQYRWDEAAGRKRFSEALDLIAMARRHESGRLSGIVFPAQIDTCTEDLLRDSHAAASDEGLPFTTHCSQTVNEFNEMVSRNGMTPIQWAAQIGLLGPRTTLGHAIFLDEHSWLHWHTRDDLRLLGKTRTSVGHCPSPFARYGQMLENFGSYVKAGVNMTIGTDVSPHNLIEEMRLAATLARIAAENINGTNLSEIFAAATVGGAQALLRDDIGRLAIGMKADLVLVDLKNPFMMPARDPLRSLIYAAADRAVRDVFIDGRKVVEQGRVLTLDHTCALERLAEGQARMEKDVSGRDYRARTASDIAPPSLRTLA